MGKGFPGCPGLRAILHLQTNQITITGSFLNQWRTTAICTLYFLTTLFQEFITSWQNSEKLWEKMVLLLTTISKKQSSVIYFWHSVSFSPHPPAAWKRVNKENNKPHIWNLDISWGSCLFYWECIFRPASFQLLFKDTISHLLFLNRTKRKNVCIQYSSCPGPNVNHDK